MLLEAALFPLSHLLKSQSTDARSEALATGGACGIKAPEPHLHLLAPLGIPICQWIHLNTYLDEPQNACLRPSRPRRSATSLLHGLHRLRGGCSLRGLLRETWRNRDDCSAHDDGGDDDDDVGDDDGG